MKLVDRLIFIIVGLFLTAIAAGCVLLAVDVVALSDIRSFLFDISIGTLEMIVLFASAIILFAVALRIFFVRPKKTKLPAYTISKNDDGEISVSITAIENAIRLAMANFDDIKEVKINISVNDMGIAVSARVAVPTGVIIPQLLDEVKVFVKTFTELHTGVTITSIKLTATEFKGSDAINELKKASAEQRKEEKRSAARAVDAYAATHAKIVLAKTEEETSAEANSDETLQDNAEAAEGSAEDNADI